MATRRTTPREQQQKRRFALAVERLWDDFKTPTICAALDRQRFKPLMRLEGFWREKLADYNRDPRHKPLTTWTRLYEVRMFRPGISQTFRHAVAKVRDADTQRKTLAAFTDKRVEKALEEAERKREREAELRRLLAWRYLPLNH